VKRLEFRSDKQKHDVGDAETTTPTLADSESRASRDSALEPQRFIGITLFGLHGVLQKDV
jgi:hypothetical protein